MPEDLADDSVPLGRREAAPEGDLEVFLADLAMPRLGGMGLLGVLQTDPRTREVPVVFLSAQTDPRTVVDCFSHGAADFIAKPGRPDELRIRLQHAWTHARRVARLESLARTDALTGLHNFRAMQSKLDEEFARAARYAEPLALLLVTGLYLFVLPYATRWHSGRQHP